MSTREYVWPNDNPIKIFDGAISQVAEKISPADVESAKQKLYASFTQAAFQGDVSAVDLTYIHEPRILSALREHVIPALSDWFAKFPEDLPRLIDDSRDRGGSND